MAAEALNAMPFASKWAHSSSETDLGPTAAPSAEQASEDVMGRGVKRTFHNERSASFLSLKHFCDFEGAVVLLIARSRKRQSQPKTLDRTDLTYFL